MKQLSHRLADGRCRDCGQHSEYSAPDTCPRCAVVRYRERGYEVVVNPVAQFVHVADETWRLVAQAMQTGAVKAGRFYLYAGLNDGGPLSLPLGDESPHRWEEPTAGKAHRIARELLGRYPQVWVVTTVGCWSAVPPRDAGQ